MRVTVTLEHRFDRTPDGRVWTQTMFPVSFWQRYLSVFEGVRVVARCRPVATVPRDYLRVDGSGIDVFPVPHYLGPAEYARKAWHIRTALRQTLATRDAFLLRVSSQLANCLHRPLLQSGRPFAAEVVCDPWNVFAPRAVRHPLRPWFRRYFSRLLREQCYRAAAVSYVTREALQARYPAGPNAFSTHCSDVDLPPAAFTPRPRIDFPQSGRFRVISIGSLSVPYKGMDVLIESVAKCIQNGADVELVIVGDGKCRQALERQAAATGYGNRIQFRGQIAAGEAVRAELNAAHLFVLASRQEGVPRAMLEAMARSLPCLGTNIGGIPELLPAEDLVELDAPNELANQIRHVARDAERWQRMGERNWKRAAEYSDDQLQVRRVAFFQALRMATERWLEMGERHSLAESAEPAATAVGD